VRPSAVTTSSPCAPSGPARRTRSAGSRRPRGRAQQRRRLVLAQRRQALHRVHAAERDDHRADVLAALIRGPELNVRAERVGQGDAVARADVGGAEHRVQAAPPPRPVLGRVEDAQRRAGRAAGLVRLRIALQRCVRFVPNGGAPPGRRPAPAWTCAAAPAGRRGFASGSRPRRHSRWNGLSAGGLLERGVEPRQAVRLGPGRGGELRIGGHGRGRSYATAAPKASDESARGAGPDAGVRVPAARPDPTKP
jgi:hypothetical protein